MRTRRLLIISTLLCIAMFLCSTIGCSAEKQHVDISVSQPNYVLAKGEKVALRITPSDVDYTITSRDSLVAHVENGVLYAGSVGKTNIEVRHGDDVINIPVAVYDRIVSPQIDGKRRYASISTALEECEYGDIIYITRGKYGEQIKIDSDITLIGEDGVSISSAMVMDGHDVKIENIDFYTSDYPIDSMGSLTVGSNASITVRDCSFFVDKKTDKPENRIGGSAIYVYPNSSFVQVIDSSITGYNTGIAIGGTGGVIHIDNNRFFSLNLGVEIDVRDNVILPINKPATGSVRGNVFSSVTRDIDLLFAGEEYNGMIYIEKHDKID